MRSNQANTAIWLSSVCLLAACAGEPVDVGDDPTDAAVQDAAVDDTSAGSDTTTTADSGASSGGAEDSGSLDAGTGLPPAPDEKCDTNDECSSGFCVQGPDGKVCAPKCIDTCPAHWSCTGVQAGGDLTYVCLPRFITLCQPCREHKDCKDLLQGGEAFCVDRGDSGSYCGGECDPTGKDLSATCPLGYLCEPYTTEGGKQTGQCRRATGECPCNERAVAQKMTTGG